MLRLGVPMGFASFVEITAFTFIALFVAPLGAAVVAGHRVVSSLSGAGLHGAALAGHCCTLSATGQAVEARSWVAAKNAVVAGTSLAAVLSTACGILIWLFSHAIVSGYSDDPAVQGVAKGLLFYIVIYQFFDALQTVAGYVLRAYRVTFVPMLLQTACFAGRWGHGRGGSATGGRRPWVLGVLAGGRFEPGGSSGRALSDNGERHARVLSKKDCEQI